MFKNIWYQELFKIGQFGHTDRLIVIINTFIASQSMYAASFLAMHWELINNRSELLIWQFVTWTGS